MNKETQQFLNYYTSANLLVDGIIGTKSITSMKKAIKKLKDTFQEKNYNWNDELNLIAIRTNDTFTDNTTDWFLVVKSTGLIAVPCSTKAGKYWVNNPVSYGGITGTAVLLEGQYKDAYQFITSRNWNTLWLKTPYFQQVLPVTIYRDGNKDNKIDRKITQKGLFGINIHTAGWNTVVWNWSAGCIVIPRTYWLHLLPNFIANQRYTLTLI